MASSGQKRTASEGELAWAMAQPPVDEEAAVSTTGASASATATGAANRTASQLDNDEMTGDEQRRLEDRRAYNRANSARARLRAKQQIESLQATVQHQVRRLQEVEQSNAELTEAVARLKEEKESLQQTIQQLRAASSVGGGGVGGGGGSGGGVPRRADPLDSTSSLLFQRGGPHAPSFPLQQLGNAAGSASSLQQGLNSMQLLASLGGGAAFDGGSFRDNRGQGFASAAAAAAVPSTAAMPASAYLESIQANAYLEAIRSLRDSRLHPYLGSLPTTQSQSDSHRAALLAALLNNSITATTTQSTARNINPAILHHLQTLGVPLNQTDAALELLLARQQNQGAGGRSNDESENSKNQPTR
jgi:hypothetical protein